MKGTLKTIAVVLLCVIGFVACKKDYKCKCSVTIDLPIVGTSSSDTTITIEKAKKKDAKSKCDGYGSDLNSQAQMLNGSASCSLQ